MSLPNAFALSLANSGSCTKIGRVDGKKDERVICAAGSGNADGERLLTQLRLSQKLRRPTAKESFRIQKTQPSNRLPAAPELQLGAVCHESLCLTYIYLFQYLRLGIFFLFLGHARRFKRSALPVERPARIQAQPSSPSVDSILCTRTEPTACVSDMGDPYIQKMENSHGTPPTMLHAPVSEVRPRCRTTNGLACPSVVEERQPPAGQREKNMLR